jgi:hypothetical protein
MLTLLKGRSPATVMTDLLLAVLIVGVIAIAVTVDVAAVISFAMRRWR